MSRERWPAQLRWLAWLVAGVFWALASPAAFAQSSPASAAEDPRGPVEIVLVGQLATDPVFAARVSSWFALGQLRVLVHQARWLEAQQVLAPAADAGVHVWVTYDGSSLARLYLASARGSKGSPSYFLRELRLEHGLDEIGAEHLAEVLNLSTLAFLEGQAESAREELERTLRAEAAVAQPKTLAVASKPPQVAPPPASKQPTGGPSSGRRLSERRLRGGVGYAASYRDDEGIWHGPSAALEVALWRKLGLRLAAQGALPSQRALAPLELRFYGAALQLAPSLRHAVTSSVELRAFAGPALELVHYAPARALSPDYGTGEAATEARPALALGLAASWGQGPFLALVAQATLPLTRTHYDVVQAGSREVIGRASLVVPTVGAEIGF